MCFDHRKLLFSDGGSHVPNTLRALSQSSTQRQIFDCATSLARFSPWFGVCSLPIFTKAFNGAPSALNTNSVNVCT